jgi:nucleotidyltransferase/DNA polymerase involved in DNA repair
VKVRRVTVNNRKAQVELTTRSGEVYPMPFSRLDPRPTPTNRIRAAYVDRELASEAVTYVLESGAEGVVHIDQALEYNQDPAYFADLLVHQLTAEAVRGLDRSGLSRREIARRLKTSVPQVYRLLDPTNSRKSISQLVSLLHVLDCDVQLVVKRKTAA